jgi:hypothetical protein
MATLNPSNITNGNTIEAEDILQLYRAFGTGSGDPITGVVISGSLNGTATSSSFAVNAQTSSISISSSFAVNAQTSSISISSSIAQTSSFSLRVTQSWTSPISNPTGSPYIINSSTPNFVIVNTTNVVGFSFDPGYEGQIVEFINDPSLIYITSSKIALTSSAVDIYGYSGYILNVGTNEILGTFLDNGGGSGTLSQFYSFKMQYRNNDWYFLYFNTSA